VWFFGSTLCDSSHVLEALLVRRVLKPDCVDQKLWLKGSRDVGKSEPFNEDKPTAIGRRD
jgi:hypothetical protein